MFLIIFLLSTLFDFSFGHGYCVDAYCPLKCCQDFYTCAVTADCQSQFKSYTWPYPEGSSCSSAGDCVTDCCYSSTCKSKNVCQIIKAAVGGCISLGFLLIVWIICYVIRRRRLLKEQKTYSAVKAVEKVESEATNASTIIQNSEDFNPQGYCEDKLAMNKAGGPNFRGGMPCKPIPGIDFIVSKFEPST